MERRFEERRLAMLAECEVDPTSLDGMLQRLETFVKPFANLLTSSEQRDHLRDYVAGLCSSVERKTSETIAYFHGQDRQPLQRFLGWVEWDHRPLLRELARQVADTLGEPEGVLVLDSSAFAKKGTESVGVQRQWNGRAGKIDNCQVGVYRAYASRREQALVDVRLFLPRSWASAKTRRRKCRVPEAVRFATKLELAREMVEEHGELLPHAWVLGDDEFGRSTQFRRDLRRLGEQYLLAVPSNTLVRDLQAEPPPYRGFGKRPLAPFVRVDQWCARLPADAWTRINVRDGEQGPLLVDVAVTRVLAITERTRAESEEVLVVTRRVEADGTLVHDYWLSNAAPDTPRREFARASKSRGRIEQCLERGKSDTGLADYETRSWPGWHHHQTLSLLASWFLVLERISGGEKDAGPHVLASACGDRDAAVRRDRPAFSGPHRTRNAHSTGPQRNGAAVPLEETQPITSVTRTTAEMN